jgi:hypothetical protein
MASQIVNPTTFNVSTDMIFTKLKVGTKGNKSIGLLGTASKKPLLVQTPLMMTWGVNEYEQDNQPTSYSVNLQFPRTEDSTKSIQAYLSMVQEFETAVKNYVAANSMECFGKKLSEEVISDKWTPILKYPKNKETGEPELDRMPTMRIKLPIWDGKPGFDLYDVDNNLLVSADNGRTADEFIQKGSHMANIIKCGGIWFAGGNFGVTWRLYQGKVKPVETLETGVCHISLSEEELNTKVTYTEDEEEESSSGGNTKTVTTYDTDEEVDPSDVPAEEAPVEEAPVEEAPVETPKKGTKKSKK